jgi:hypothetical protein
MSKKGRENINTVPVLTKASHHEAVWDTAGTMHALTQPTSKHVFLPELSWCLVLLTLLCLPSHAVKFVSVHLGKAPFFSDVSSSEGLIEYLDQV